MENKGSGKIFRIKFNSENGKGITIPDFDHVLKITNKESGQEFLTDAGKAKEELERKELETKLQGISNEVEASLDIVDSGDFIKPGSMYRAHNNDAWSVLDSILNKQSELLKRYEDNGERTPELLADFEKIKQGVEELTGNVAEWKKEKEVEEKFLEQNKGWEEQFEKATQNIEEFSGPREEFEKKYENSKVDKNFPFDLKEKLASYLEGSKTDIGVFFNDSQELWSKVYAAVKMINDPRTPKTFVSFEGQTFVVDKVEKVEKKKIENTPELRKKNIEELNKIVAVKLRKALIDAEIKGVFSLALKTGDLRYLSFIVGKDIIENEDILNRFAQDKNNKQLLPEEEKVIDDEIAKLFDNNNQKANELMIQVFVYNKIGDVLSKIKNLTLTEKYLKQRELVDGFLEKIDKETGEFVARRQKENDFKIGLEEVQREEIKQLISVYVREALGAEISTGDDAENESKVEDAKKPAKTEKEKAMEEKRDLIVDKILGSLHKLEDEFKSKENLLAASEIEGMDRFFEQTSEALHELHDADFNAEFKERIGELKKQIADKFAEIARLVKVEDEKDVATLAKNRLEKQLEDGNDISAKLFESWKKLPDFERESPEFEGIYHVLDIAGKNYFQERFDKINALKDIDEEEKHDRIERKITYLQTMHDRVNEILKNKGIEVDGEIKADENKKAETKGEDKNKEAASQKDNDKERDFTGIVERKKRFSPNEQLKAEELWKELLAARKEYEKAYAEKAERFSVVLTGLGSKPRFEELMAKDSDIAFYREDYQQILEQYLVTCFEGEKSELEALIEKIEQEDSNAGWIDKKWQKVKKILLDESTIKNNPLKIEKSDEELLRVFPAESEQATDTTASKETENIKKEQEAELDYEGGINKLGKDLLLLMNMIVRTERDIVKSEPGAVLRDMKVVDLLKGANEEYFKKLPERGQKIIKKMVETKELDLNDKEITLRSFAMKTLAFVKSNNHPSKE